MLQKAVEIIEGYEGLGGARNNRFYAYQGGADKLGTLTIGRGHVLSHKETHSQAVTIAGKSVNIKNGLTLDQVDQLFDQDVAPRLDRVKSYMPGANENELSAGLSLLYNIETPLKTGTPGVAWRAGEKKTCAAGFLLYCKSNGQFQRGLWRRRMTEALCLLTGEVYIAKDNAREAVLYEKLNALGLFTLAKHMNEAQHLGIPFFKA